MERFTCSTGIISGPGAMDALSELEGSRLFLVTDPLLSRNGTAQKLLQQLKRPDTAVYDAVGPLPAMKQAVEGTARLKAFSPDLVVALGDEAVLDCAKAMVCFAKSGCPLAAVPVDFGSGAEATDRVTLVHDGRHHRFQNPAMAPKWAFLDAGLLEGMSRKAIGSAGFSVLAHALEAFTARASGHLTGLYAREAFCDAWAALPASYAGDPAARQKLQIASAMAGMAYTQAGLGLCAALSRALQSLFPVSRGLLCGILLPAVIGCNAHAAGKAYARLGRAAGLGGSTEAIAVENLKTGLIRLRRELGLPATLATAGLNPGKVWRNAPQIVRLTLEAPECRENPVTVDDFMVRRVLEAVTGRL